MSTNNIDIIDVKWDELNLGYNDMYERLLYISSKKSNNSDNNSDHDHMLAKKIYLLVSEMNNVILRMEQICNTIDESYAKKGEIISSENHEKHENHEKECFANNA